MTPEEIADLEDEWSRTANEVAAFGQIGFIPYPIPAFTQLLTAVQPYVPAGSTFLDLGAGIGTKCLIAAQLGYAALGVEIIPAYLGKAAEIGAKVVYGDVRTEPVTGTGVVYLNHPLADPVQERALEERVRANLSPNAVLICVHSPDPAPAGAHWRTLAEAEHGYAVQKIS